MEATITPAPTQLQILEHALEVAERVGAVKDGGNFFEHVDQGDRVEMYGSNVTRTTAPEVCGVCLAAAPALALLELTNAPSIDLNDMTRWFGVLQQPARLVMEEMLPEPNEEGFSVVGDHVIYPGDGIFSDMITALGTPYVVNVLKKAIELEREEAKLNG